MPITIKEILPSDSMSGVVEKINFNFDQLVLAGGGPPGPIGPAGPAGPVGVQGTRGDHWFAGSSAFGQTADHDPNLPLQIEDHYLDTLGDVYAYFDIAGVTGWTYTGINLKGPTGGAGATGNSNEWQLRKGFSSNSISAPGWFPDTNFSEDPVLPNFATLKKGNDLLFLGDWNWGWNYLQQYGRASSVNANAAPKIGIIQNQVDNSNFGLNGLAFGAYGITGGKPSPSGYVGGPALINNPGATTSAKNFGYIGLYQDDLNWLNSTLTNFFTKFGIRTTNIPIKIEAGRGSANDWWSSQPLELLGNTVRIAGYEDGQVGVIRRQILLGAESDIITMNSGQFYGRSQEISLNSVLYFNGNSGSAPTSFGNTWKYGYIGLQNSLLGLSMPTLPSGKEHHFGTVIIGPTFAGTLGSSSAKTLGIDGYQGLAINRQITSSNTSSNGYIVNPANQSIKDTHLVFGYPDYKDPSDTNSRSSWIGHMMGIRTLADAGVSGAVVDSIIIQAGDRPGLGSSTSAVTTGRIGIQNGYSDLRKPQMPLHVQMQFLTTDAGIRPNAYDGGYTYQNSKFIQGWIAGFDAYTGQKRASGVGIGYKGWGDGITSLIPGSYYTNPVINTYFRTDNGQAAPIDGFGPTYNGYGLGINNPHLYMQTGGETFSGNLAIGLYPSNGVTGGLTYSAMVAPYTKLAVGGAITVAGQDSGYHQYAVVRPNNGILIEGAYLQGATSIKSLYATSIFGGTSIYANIGGLIAMSLQESSMARNFIAKGYASAGTIADFALPDTKTGMMALPYDPIPGNGYLVANPDPLVFPSGTGPTQTTGPVPVAKFTHRGEAGYTANLSYPGFSVLSAFAQKPDVVTTSELTQNLWKFSTGGAAFNLFSVWTIPVRASTVFLDLSGPRGDMAYFGPGPAAIGQTGTWYLSGEDTSSGGSILAPSSYNMGGFTLEDGHYDGQVLDLIVGVVEARNQGVIIPSIPKGVSQFASVSVTPSSVASIPDNICMQAEPWDVDLTTYPYGNLATPYNYGWPLQQANSIQYATTNAPFPYPYGAVNSSSAFNTTSAVGGTAWSTNKNSWFRNRFTLWTDNASAPTTSSGTLTYSAPSGIGFGAFRVTSYRSIKFVWKFDNATTKNGCWFEITRSNLVVRQNRSWAVGSGNGGAGTVIVAAGPVLDPTLGGGTPTTGGGGGGGGACCFIAGTEITLSNGDTKLIENMVIGDSILSYNESTGSIVENEVIGMLTPIRNSITTITFDNGTVVGITEDHPIFSPSRGWLAIDSTKASEVYEIPVGQLLVDDEILTENGSIRVTSIHTESTTGTQTYTIKTKNEDSPSYFANGILAHNPATMLICANDPIFGLSG